MPSPAVTNPFVSTREAERYHRFRPRYHDLPFQQLRAFLGHDVERTLDVACGTGHSTEALTRISKTAVGCDASSAMLTEARRALPHCELVQAQAEQLPFPEATFTLVNVSMAFHWLNQEAFVREAHRVLAPGGYLSLENYGFFGSVPGNPAFEDFHKKFYVENFPSPSRNPNFPEDAAMEPLGFRLAKEFTYELATELTLGAFVEFLLTQSNVIVKTGSREETSEKLRQAYAPFFKITESETLTFEGKLKLYRSV